MPPYYDYCCHDCDHEVEVFHGMKAVYNELCEKCGGDMYKKVSPIGGVKFNGNGFYENDYKEKK